MPSSSSEAKITASAVSQTLSTASDDPWIEQAAQAQFGLRSAPGRQNDLPGGHHLAGGQIERRRGHLGHRGFKLAFGFEVVLSRGPFIQVAGGPQQRSNPRQSGEVIAGSQAHRRQFPGPVDVITAKADKVSSLHVRSATGQRTWVCTRVSGLRRRAVLSARTARWARPLR